jgi:signal peptidase II
MFHLKVLRVLLLPFLIILSVFFFHWWVRATINQTIDLHESLTVIKSFFSVTHIRNPGAAFGIFSKLDSSFRLPLLLGTSFVALLLIGYVLIKSRRDHWTIKVGLSLLAGGALGNLCERLIYGEVLDYLDFYLGNYHWPAFNVADVSISTGIGFILLFIIVLKSG